MANPSNALGTPNEYSGLTSREGYAAGASNAFSRGIVSGFNVRQNTTLNMTVLVGGISGTKDVALAQSPNGDMYTIYNKSNAPISVTIPTAPSTNSRIDSIVLYRDLLVTSSSATTDNPAVVGVQVVSGASATSPVAPTDSQIRSALTNGSSAAFCVIANVTVASGTTTITNAMISQSGLSVLLTPPNIAAANVNAGTTLIASSKLDFTTLNFGNYSTSEVNTGFTWVDGKAIYKKTINFGSIPSSTTKNVAHGVTDLDRFIKYEASLKDSTNNNSFPLPFVRASGGTDNIELRLLSTNVTVTTNSTNFVNFSAYITIYYTKL